MERISNRHTRKTYIRYSKNHFYSRYIKSFKGRTLKHWESKADALYLTPEEIKEGISIGIFDDTHLNKNLYLYVSITNRCLYVVEYYANDVIYKTKLSDVLYNLIVKLFINRSDLDYRIKSKIRKQKIEEFLAMEC